MKFFKKRMAFVILLAVFVNAIFVMPQTIKKVSAESNSYTIIFDGTNWSGYSGNTYKTGDTLNIDITIDLDSVGVIINGMPYYYIFSDTTSYTFQYAYCSVTLDGNDLVITDLPITVAYDLNDGDAPFSPISTLTYGVGDTVTLASTSGITKEGYTILGWALTDDATEALTSYQVSLADAVDTEITFYAVWQKIIIEEPSETNDYKVVVADSITNVTYQWQKASYSWVNATQVGLYFCNFSNGVTLSNNTVFASNNFFLQINEGITSLRFKYEGTGTISNCTISSDGYYYPTYDSANKYFLIQIADRGENDKVTDIEACAPIFSNIASETNAQLGSNENGNYRCVVTLPSNEQAISDVITLESRAVVGTGINDSSNTLLKQMGLLSIFALASFSLRKKENQ